MSVFSVINAVLVRPLPFDRSGRIVSLFHTLNIPSFPTVDVSDGVFLFYRRANRAFVDLAVYQPSSVNLGRLSGASGSSEAERASAGRVSAGFFTVVNVPPLVGRVFSDDDDRPHAPSVVLLSEALWRRKYGADPGVVGRSLEVDGSPHEVIGIMPAYCRFPASDTQVWVPIRIDPAHLDTASFDYLGIGRLRDGVDGAAVVADLAQLLPHVPEAYPGRLTAASIEQIHLRPAVRPLRDTIVGDVGRLLWIVFGAVGFVLAITCANVANLFLVRAEGRRRELIVRRMLGASRLSLVVELMSEALLLAVAGGAAGFGLAAAGLRVLRSFGETIALPRLSEVGIDPFVIAVAGLCVLATAAAVTVVPALRMFGGSSAVSVEGSRAATGRAHHVGRKTLVISQVSLALVLLAGSGLMARSFVRLRNADTGFDPSHALTFHIALAPASNRDGRDRERFLGHALEEIAAIDGVRAAGVVSKLPLDGQSRRFDTGMWVDDRPNPYNGVPVIHQVVFVTPGYFDAMRIPLVAGRAFERMDPARPTLEAMVSRAFADRYWKDGSAVGRRLRMLSRGPWYTIVGVVGSVRGAGLEQPPEEIVYAPIVTPVVDSRWKPGDVAFVVRTSGDPGACAPAIRSRIRALDSNLPVFRVKPLVDVVGEASARTSFMLMLLAVASAVALGVGATGIYGVLSYLVTLRTREIGVRLALGAAQPDVRWMVWRQAMTLTLSGIAVGLAIALVATRALAALLFEVSPRDPSALAAATGTLLVVSQLASWWPARRAARVDPAQALRDE